MCAVGVSTQQSDYLKFLFELSEDFTALPTFGVIPAFASMMASSGIPGFPIDPTKVCVHLSVSFQSLCVFISLFFFCVPRYNISGVHHLGWDFCVCGCFLCVFFLNPTIQVVTFCLRGWCMLGVFLLLALTRLEHRMHVFSDQTSVYTLIQKSFRGMESEPMSTPGEKCS